MKIVINSPSNKKKKKWPWNSD